MTDPTPTPSGPAAAPASGDLARILCIRTDRIGDMMVSTPVFRALRQRFPAARLDVLASTLNRIAIDGNPHIDTVYVFDRKAFWTWPGLCLTLRRNRYDACIVLSSASRTTCFIMQCLGIPQRFGYHVLDRDRHRFTEVLPRGSNDHVLLGLLDGLTRFGIHNASPELDFVVPEATRAAMARRFPHEPGRVRLALFIGNIKKLHNRWPPEQFGELADRLLAARPEVDLVIFSGPSDRPLLEHFRRFENTPRVSVFVGESFQESGAFLECCHAIVCGSSGPTHLATALGVPVLSIITQYNVRYWRPLGPRDQWVAPPTDITDMRQIPVDEVFAMVNTFVSDSIAHNTLSETAAMRNAACKSLASTAAL